MDGSGHRAGAPGGGEEDTMRLYQVFQNSFNKITSKDGTAYPPGAAPPPGVDPSDPAGAFAVHPGQFSQQQQENFSPEHPYFPFASSSGQNSAGASRLPSASRVKADKDGDPGVAGQQWYGDEFAPKIGGYHEAGGGGGYFESGAGGAAENWQNYAAAGAYSPSPASHGQPYPPSSTVDSILYPPPPPPGSQDFSTASAGTPPVSSPAGSGYPPPTSVSSAGPRGNANIDDALNVLRHHAAPEFLSSSASVSSGLPPMEHPSSGAPHSTNGALLAAAGAASYLDDMGSEYQLPNQSEASTSDGIGGGAKKRKSDGTDMSDKPSSSSSGGGAKRGKRKKESNIEIPEDDSMPPEVSIEIEFNPNPEVSSFSF
jgi:hypothetical protein